MNLLKKKLRKLCVFWRIYLWLLILVVWIVIVLFITFTYKLPLLSKLHEDVALLCQYLLVAGPILISLVIWNTRRIAIKRFTKKSLQPLGRRDISEVLYLLIILEEKIGLYNITRHRSKRPILMFALWFKSWTTCRLARWMGLTNEKIHFSISHMEERVAGRAYLHDDVIEINNSTIKHPESFLSTLCHELAHILLQQIRVHADIDNDEELLTDMLCVFLGFGDAMLNGCISTAEDKEYVGCDKYRITTETINVGYLSPLKLAIAELIVLNMYKGMKGIAKTYNFSARYLINTASCQLIDMGMSFYKPKELSCLNYLKLLQTRLKEINS